MAKTKKKTIINVTLEDAQEASRTFAENKNKLDKIEAKMTEEMNKIRTKYQDQITELTDSLDEPMEVLEVFAKEQKESWGKKKSMPLLHCVIGFRTGTPKVTKSKKFSWEAVLALLKKNTSLKEKFVRSKDEINKEAILAEKDTETLTMLSEECYIEIDKDESFYIEPKVEEVAA